MRGAELEPIVFSEVYPLYALSDIRGSSTQRARAIQADLLGQLRLAREVVATRLRRAAGCRRSISSATGSISTSSRSRDIWPPATRSAVVAFLRAEVETLLDRLATFGDAVRGG